MDLVQLTTHIDATAVRAAISEPDVLSTRETREAIAERVRANSSQAAMLLVFDGGDHWVHELTVGSHRIGRSITADVQLEDPMVSRRHAVIERGDAVIRVVDDRSLNGVFVNGERVGSTHVLGDGDELTIGDFVLRVLIND